MYELNRQKEIPVVRFKRLSSTSDYAKERQADGKEMFVVAQTQTKGRGREGRTFSSKRGGLYMSWLCFPQDLLAKEGFFLVSKMAVAVCKTLEDYGLSPTIKWPNDVLIDGKKICGILTENLLMGNRIYSAIIGVGLNVYNRLERELRPIATTLRQESGKKIPVAEVENKLLEYIKSPFEKEEYYARLGCLGEVEIIENGVRSSVIAEGVDDEGLLVVVKEGKREKKSSAEISLRMKGKA